MLKFLALSATTAGLLCAGCATYSERVVEKPAPATTTRSTTTYTEPVAQTTVYSTPATTTTTYSR